MKEFKDIHGQTVENGDLILRDGTFIEVVHDKDNLRATTIWPNRFTSDYDSSALFSDNWGIFKSQGLEVLAKGILAIEHV